MAPAPPDVGPPTPDGDPSIDALLDLVEAGGEDGVRAAAELGERFSAGHLESLLRLLVAWRDLSPAAMSTIAHAWSGR